MLRKVLREVIVLRKLSEIDKNIYTTKLIDIILPSKCYVGKIAEDGTEQMYHDLDQLTHIFLVMEVSEYDLKNVMDNITKADFDEEHVLTLIYNILTAVSFMHSANLIHRDIKPANILVDDNCRVKICDFGLARALPKKDVVD